MLFHLHGRVFLLLSLQAETWRDAALLCIELLWLHLDLEILVLLARHVEWIVVLRLAGDLVGSPDALI